MSVPTGGGDAPDVEVADAEQALRGSEPYLRDMTRRGGAHALREGADEVPL
ncbi:MAG TPA: hypothetical protein VGG75_02345 [Trebonia sp.]